MHVTTAIFTVSGLVVAANAGCASWDTQKAGQDFSVKNGGNDPSGTCAELPLDIEADKEYTFTATMTDPTANICFGQCIAADPDSAGCTFGCSEGKGVGSASLTVKCSAASLAKWNDISIGCNNSISGCACPTDTRFSLAYKELVPPWRYTADGEPPICEVDASGYTHVFYKSTQHPSFKCTHSSDFTKTAGGGWPTNAAGQIADNFSKEGMTVESCATACRGYSTCHGFSMTTVGRCAVWVEDHTVTPLVGWGAYNSDGGRATTAGPFCSGNGESDWDLYTRDKTCKAGSDCTCTLKHPTHDRGGCKQVESKASGKLIDGGGDCTDSGKDLPTPAPTPAPPPGYAIAAGYTARPGYEPHGGWVGNNAASGDANTVCTHDGCRARPYTNFNSAVCSALNSATSPMACKDGATFWDTNTRCAGTGAHCQTSCASWTSTQFFSQTAVERCAALCDKHPDCRSFLMVAEYNHNCLMSNRGVAADAAPATSYRTGWCNGEFKKWWYTKN